MLRRIAPLHGLKLTNIMIVNHNLCSNDQDLMNLDNAEITALDTSVFVMSMPERQAKHETRKTNAS